MKSYKSWGAFAVLAALALSLSVWGQATTSLRGQITDPSGAAIPGAKLTLTNIATNVPRQTTTTSTGLYTFVAVQPGTYKLTVEATGFQTYTQTGVVLRVNLPATVDVKMKVGAVTQQVEVSGQPPLLNTTNASMGQTMGTQAIENLPIRAENTVLLLSFQPGVVYNGQNSLQSSYDTRAGSVNGERSDQNNITLDGVSNNDEFSGYAFNGVLPTTPFSVQEFRVTTSNYGATEGRSAGAQISMVTKSGTNHFHGSLYEFNRNNVGEANAYFLKSAQAASGEPNVPEHLVRNIFGGTIGGPFLKNRFFFFFNYEGRRQHVGATATRTIPSSTLRQGIILYQCNTAGDCPASNVAGANGQNYPVPAGWYGLGPAQLKQMDPLHIGPSQVALNYMQTFPEPNSVAALDQPNYASYTFAAPTTESFNWYIARLDYKITKNGNQTVFFRGTGVDDRSAGTPFLPGQVPESSLVDLSKGFVIGYTGVFGPHWVNSFRYGLTRASYGTIGNSNQPWVYFRDMDQGVTRSSSWVSPVHNIIDTVSWLKGSHSFEFGGNFLLMRAHSTSDGNSYSDALTNADWVDTSGFAGTGSPLDPASGGFPAISKDSYHSYDFPLAAMMGLASEIDAVYNYKVTSLTQATPLAQGASVARRWAVDSYNFYWQDTWQAFPTLSVTYGLNYQLMTPVTETSGQQVAPTVNQGTWFNTRSLEGQNGIPSNYDAPITFAPSGSYWNGPSMYGIQNKNFAPRLGFAWSPRPSGGWLRKLTGDGLTVVRAGFGMYYSNFGPELAMTYNAAGEFGLTTELQNPAGDLSVAEVPRITSMNVIPTKNEQGTVIMPPAPPATFPVTYPLGSEAIAQGIDPSIKTPYSYAVDLSIERQLPHQMTLDLAYVGHFSHRLLVYDDVAMPLNLVDPKTGISYFQAASQLSAMARKGIPYTDVTSAAAIGPTAQYWEDMMAQQPSNPSYLLYYVPGYPHWSQTTSNFYQALYNVFTSPGHLYNETSPLYDIDIYGLPFYAAGGPNTYYNSQYSSLWDWRSIGHSNYNSFQLGLHKQMSHGVLFGFNYTLSKSMDTGSFAERSVMYLTSATINAWDPNQMYGPSQFDVRNQINYYWLVDLPFGRGEMIGSHVSSWANAIIGGWQYSGTGRWTSGFPVGIFQGYVWPTNWDEMGWSNLVGPVSTGTQTVTNGTPNIFTNPAQAATAFDYAYPGQSGTINPIRGDGYFGLDMSLMKQWSIPKMEGQTIQLRWNVYNVLNTNRFDVASLQSEVDSFSSFGNYGSTLTNPRVMEFSAIYRF
jgi:hypothetical protein